MMSSEIYYLKYPDGKVWFAAYHNGACWRYIIINEASAINSLANRWFEWNGNPMVDMKLSDSIRVNNFREKPDVSNGY